MMEDGTRLRGLCFETRSILRYLGDVVGIFKIVNNENIFTDNTDERKYF